MSQQRQRAAFAHLLQTFARSTDEPKAQRWRYLEAAHVLGQNRWDLHLRAHWNMLRYAHALGDKDEARGQWRHMVMIPLGPIQKRVPHGNNGRALADPMRPMVPSAAIRQCITDAMAATAPIPTN